MMGPVLSLADFGSTEGACMRARLCRWPFVNPRRPAIPRGHRSDLQPEVLPKVRAPSVGPSPQRKVWLHLRYHGPLSMRPEKH